MGFRIFKWKVGVGDVAEELPLLDEVCAVLPSGAKLRLDANGAWDRRKAERWLERCADRPVEFVEQPVATDARGADDLLRGLAEDFPTPIALDESIAGEGDIGTQAQTLHHPGTKALDQNISLVDQAKADRGRAGVFEVHRH